MPTNFCSQAFTDHDQGIDLQFGWPVIDFELLNLFERDAYEMVPYSIMGKILTCAHLASWPTPMPRCLVFYKL